MSQTARYLSAVFQRGRLSAPLNAWKSLFYGTHYKNPIFRATLFDSQAPNAYALGVFSNHRLVPALNMASILEPKNVLFPLQEDGDQNGVPYYSVSSGGHFPLRWLYMLMDFHLHPRNFTPVITVIGDPDDYVPYYTALLQTLPAHTRKVVMFEKAFEQPHGMTLTVDEPAWVTAKNGFSPLSRSILDACNQYGSTGGHSYGAALQYAGIKIPEHRFLQEWTDYRRAVYDILPLRHACQGYYTYKIGPDITPEELVVLSECVRMSGCSYNIFIPA